jgi:prepilin-type N-terminal cleavage/methylation domain-containing protein
MMNMKKGFTMIELLIVVVILAVLAALIIPRFALQDERARVSEAVSRLSAIRQGEEALFLETNAYQALVAGSTDADWDQIGLDRPGARAQFFTYGVAVNNAAVPPTFTATATRVDDQECGNGTITLTNDGVFGGTHPMGPVPGNCRCNAGNTGQECA